MAQPDAHVRVRALTLAYGSNVIQRDLSFDIVRGSVFIVMGGSGCGKSTVMRALVGLKEPAAGEILYDGESFWKSPSEKRERLMRILIRTVFAITLLLMLPYAAVGFFASAWQGYAVNVIQVVMLIVIFLSNRAMQSGNLENAGYLLLPFLLFIITVHGIFADAVDLVAPALRCRRG